jgi:hypothetical protein
MARFCLIYGISPNEYKALTLTEYKKFIDVAKELNK